MILKQLFGQVSSILEVLGTLGHPFGDRGGQDRFYTSIFGTFLEILAALEPQREYPGRPEEPNGGPNSAKSDPKGSPKWSRKSTFTDSANP